jgi:multidrug resistance efflux pump
MSQSLSSTAPSAERSKVGAVTLGRLLVFGGAAWLMGLALSTWLGEAVADSVPGTLQAKTISVAVARPAQVAELFVKPGQAVEPEAPLFRLADDRLATRLASKRREIIELTAELKRVEAAAEVDLEWRCRELQNEAFETQLKAAEFLQARVHHQVEQIAWREQLTGQDWWVGDVASDEWVQPIAFDADAPNPARLQALLKSDEAATSLESNAAQLALCERKLIELVELEARLANNVRISAGVDVAKAKLQRAEDELKALEEQEQALTIRSPGYGTVGGLTAQIGDVLAAGQCVVDLLDDDQRFLLANVPSASIARFQPGEQVGVRFPSRQRLQGAIVAIPPQAQAAEAGQDAMVPVRIAPSGKLWPKLPIGSRVRVEMPRG